MVSELNKLAELVELDAVPLWLREQIELKKPAIIQDLQTQGFAIVTGPNGEEVRIQSKEKARAAA